ncbi:MAG TPA: tetratricopeptide repeat protein [Thermoanaerobaculia bacterium]|nr:tetratricopeptide repeat protein [Thermoanaerobaculia bacterium]
MRSSYEMATGQRPFEGKSPSEVIEQIVHSAPKAIGRLNYEVPPELERIIRKCLEKDPGSRYQAAREIVIDLRTLKRDSSPGMTRPVQRPARRRATVAAIGTLLVAAALLAAAWHLRSRGHGGPAIDSIAVLPFANGSNDPQAEYLSDGITESIINSLSQLPQLKVMSRSTVFRFKGSGADAQNIGRQLNVRAVVSGRVSQMADRLVVAAELVNTADGAQLWGERYSRPMSDILTIQEEISREISEKLRIRLSGAEQQRLTRRHTEDPEAYQLYLKGRYYWNKRTASNLERAIASFHQAIEKDPRYALAYAGLADSYALLPEYAGARAEESMLKARAAAQKALELDESMAEAHATLALVEAHFFNHAASEAEIKRAIELKPNYATAYQWYSLHLRRFQRLDEALETILKARELDPLSPIINLNVGLEYYTRGEHAQAIREYESLLSLDPGFAWARTYLGRVLVSVGRCDEALEHLRAGADGTERAGEAVGWLAYGEARCGNVSAARQLLVELLDYFRQGRGAGLELAAVHVAFGDHEHALTQLEEGHAKRDPSLVDLPAEPELAPLRPHPRYRELVRRMGLPP